MPVFRIGRSLLEAGLIEPRFEDAIREVYAVCSPQYMVNPLRKRKSTSSGMWDPI